MSQYLRGRVVSEAVMDAVSVVDRRQQELARGAEKPAREPGTKRLEQKMRLTAHRCGRSLKDMRRTGRFLHSGLLQAKKIPACFWLRCLDRKSRVVATGAEIGSGKRVPDALSAL